MMHTCDTDRIATSCKQRFNAILQFRPYDGMLVPTTHIPSTPRVYGAVGCTRCLGVATPPAPSTSSQLHLLSIYWFVEVAVHHWIPPEPAVLTCTSF